MAVLGSIDVVEPIHRGDVGRNLVALVIAFGMHVVLLQLFMFKASPPEFYVENYIAVKLIKLPPKPQTPEHADRPPEIEDAFASSPPKVLANKKTATPQPSQDVAKPPQILTSQQPVASADTGNTVPLSKTGMTPSPASKPPSEARIDEGLKALATELKCLNGFDTGCAEIRKDVFKEFQMSETDKVYTKKYAHTGLPVEFYGLDEREIRQKLGLHLAGENGIILIPGLLGIDGRWWDNLHGVNKHCEWKFAAPAKSNPFTRSGELSSAVRHGAIKDCPDYLPAAREDRVRRNKFKLKANE